MGRHWLALPLCSLLILLLMFAPAAWCLESSCPQGPPDAAELPGVIVSAGYGKVFLDGANGRSRGYDYKSLGFVDGISKSRRVQYTPGVFREFNPRFVWDSFSFLNFGSSFYAGPMLRLIPEGDTIDFEFRIDLNTVSLDLNFGHTFGPAGVLAIGPRFQGGVYQDSLQIQAAIAGRDLIDAKLCGLFGLGAWCSVDLPAAVRWNWPERFRIFRPRLDAALTFGRGDRLNYCWGEAFLRVLGSRSIPLHGGALGIGPLTGEVGYVWSGFTESYGTSVEGRSSLTMTSLMIRGSLTIAF